MKTIKDMAHDYMCSAILKGFPLDEIDTIAERCFKLAEAMQAEAEKRKATPNADPMRKVRESKWQPNFTQVPEYCVMTDYHDGCYVYFNGELCIARGVNNTPVAVPKD